MESVFLLFSLSSKACFQHSLRCLKHQKVNLNQSVVFEPYESLVASTFKYKVIYSAINLVLVGIVAYKLSTMGLLPVSAADYVDLVPTYEPIDVLARAK